MTHYFLSNDVLIHFFTFDTGQIAVKMLQFDTNSFLSAQITECNARPDRGVGVVGSTLNGVIVF